MRGRSGGKQDKSQPSPDHGARKGAKAIKERKRKRAAKKAERAAGS